MFGFFKRTIRPVEPPNQQLVTNLPANTPAEPLLDDEIPRYPPFTKGLPATHPDKLIETQRELIGQIRETGVAAPEIFEQYHLAALRRFASYAHLLPASQRIIIAGPAGCFATRPKSPCGRCSPAIACCCLANRPREDAANSSLAGTWLSSWQRSVTTWASR